MSLMANYALFVFCCLASIYSSDGQCIVEGVIVWQEEIIVNILDTHDGIVLQRGVTNIVEVTEVLNTILNGGPYMTATIEGSNFIIRTNEAFRQYEENEIEQRISATYTFQCTGGTTSPGLLISLNITDTNNNDPMFKTDTTAASTDMTYEYTIFPPVAPGFVITDCINDMVVRDIDLTTYRIDFEIEKNDFFEIAYDEAASTVDKEFKAILRTTSFIRSLPEPIVLTIFATDVDLTGDPPRTKSTTVKIFGSPEFTLPDEPVFNRAFYIANYDENNQVSLEQPISLQQGYDEQVEFKLEGDYANNFYIVVNDNQEVSLRVNSPLSTEVLRQEQIFLVVKAIRADTSGASATVFVQLPKAVNLEFEQPHYEGQIVDNTLQLTQLILSQGYQDSTVTVTVEDYPSFFTASAVGNIITLSMMPLDANIIAENNFINLKVTASSDYSIATTIVTLEVIKDDIETPVFGKPLYAGTYDSTAGLTLEQILLVQGYDDTVQVTFSGEYEDYFELDRDGAASTLRVVGSGLPAHILSEQHLLLSVKATKPRTVGASAVVSITLPEARELQFEAPTYSGSLQDNILTLEPIILNVGYDEDVTFSLSGDHSASFTLSNVQNRVIIHLSGQLPQEVISENNFLMLTVSAAGLNALPSTTAVLLEIIKDDATTPVFSQAIYNGNYLGSSNIDIENINLVQGYDSSVSFRIEGENSRYFQIIQSSENSVTLTVQSNIPEEVIFSEKVLVFNIFADKPLTVGANAAIFIKFSEELTHPTVMQFSKNTYTGSLEDHILTLENIVLDTGFAAGTEFVLTGDYAQSFTTSVSNNIVSLLMLTQLPAEVLENNKFIVLELKARRERAVSVSTSIIIDIIEQEAPIIPVFSQAFYTGVYTKDNALQFPVTMRLLQGYDETVTFVLEGESSVWFSVEQNGNAVNLVSESSIPQDVFESNHQLLFTVVANKPNAIRGESAISIELPKEIVEQEVLRFTQNSYEGQIDGTDLQIPTITMINEISEDITLELTGEYAAYFSVSYDIGTIRVQLLNNLPSEVLSNHEFLVLGITASKPDTIDGYTTLILSIVKQPQIDTPVFEEAYYTGEYSEQNGLVFEHTIRLAQGYDESVTFTLQGDGSEWFVLTQNDQNNLSLSIAEGGIQQMENVNHFLFSIMANKAGSVPGHAAIVIHLMDLPTATPLRFSQNYYKGDIEENSLTMESISLVEGYSADVAVTFSGDYAEYFQLSDQGGTYTLQMIANIPAEIIEANNLLIYTIEANIDDTRAHATIIIEIVKNNNFEAEVLSFDATYYVASYSATSGVMSELQIRVESGDDEDVVFSLQGEGYEWFTINRNSLDSTVTIGLVDAIPIELFVNNKPLIYVLKGMKPSGSTASATIVVTLDNDTSEVAILRFEQTSYIGRIENDVSTIEPIVLSEGYTAEVSFALTGVLSSYFNLVTQGSIVNVLLQNGIPEQSIPANRIVVVQVEATAPRAISAVTTVVFEVVQEEVVAMEELVFSAPYYTGQFSEAEGLVFETAITLAEGYDENVQFTLEGDHAQWFTLVVQGNSVTLITTGGIPSAILANNQQLVFVVAAQKPSSNTARTTVVISLVDEYTDATLLGFERASYMGRIENDVSTIEPIILSEGYTTEVSFALTGDLSSYFNLVTQGSTVNVVLQSGIPEQSIPANRIVVVQVEATAPRAISAVTTVVFEVVQEEVVAMEELVFSAPYYTGQFSEAEGLVFETAITLAEGYDENVQFTLEGDHAQWFTLVVQGNSVTLITIGGIPSAILANNQQLVFVVAAQKPSSNTARTTVVISLVDDYTDATVLGFERANYIGRIENDVSTIEPIILSEGFTTEVSFALTGDLSSYFNLVTQGSTVNVVLQSGIPEQSIPANRIVVVQVEATAPRAISAVTTVVFEVVQEGVVAMEELVFSAPYYTGQFSEAEGLVFETAITLAEGYDINVQFTLEGDHAQWFTLVVQGNSVTLITTGGIPSAILANNQQLVFVVAAQKLSSNTARTTVVISLVDDYTDATVLGFERASYMGRIENDVSTIEPIILSEGYTTEVSFALTGDLSSYFNLVTQGSTVNVVLQSGIPEQSIPANRIVVVQVEATAPRAISAVTTVVFEVVQEEVVAMEDLVFSAPYYTGQFSEAEGLVFETAITLAEGYDENVQFTLEGDHAQWFTLVAQGNSVTLITTGGIPSAILANNQQLVFVVAAQKPSSNTARTTVVISLVDDYTDATVLGFERASYMGRIENDVSTIEPIILSEGYTTEVSFALTGDLSSYFNLVTQGSTVNVVLQSGIPEQLIPANRIVVVQVEATAPRAISAVTTVVFEVVQEEVVAMEELVFSAPYYTGQFSEAEGLVFETAITLAEGYDENVQFTLEGDHAQWFTLVVQGNSVTLITIGGIPSAILANNQQLVFVVAAQKPSSNTARTTVVISLVDDYTDATVLGFERASYMGRIENDVSTIEPIILSEGYTTEVSFALTGDLSSYFNLVTQGSTVNVVLQSGIPEQSIPANRIVVVQVEATAPRAISAVTTVVFEVVQEGVVAMEELVFSAPYYTGQLSEAEGLVFEIAITLAEGYDENVQFTLEGDHALWFTLVAQGNSVTLITTGGIPSAILANNQQLVFVVAAQKPSSNTARTTVVISLVDDYTDATVLGFKRASYMGRIENDVSTIEPIILSEGYTTEVSFALTGDLSSYFNLVTQGSTVNVVLQSGIPEQSIPANRIVVVQVEATAPRAISAVTTVVFEVVQEGVVAMEELVFSAPYYTGQFSEAEGLVFETAITLAEGYDINVQFTLEGDHAQWFTLVVQGNSVTLFTTGGIPSAILANNQQLVFVVAAQKPSSNTARTTVVISLVDDYTDATVLGFERASYMGRIENDVSTIEPIILSEGYTTEVSFALTGDLSSYFNLVTQGSTVNVVLQSGIPEQSIPANRIVVVQVEATAPRAISAVTTVVFEVVQEEVVAMEELVFSAPYYTGQFSEAEGLVFETSITLAEGYDENVQFTLEGDHAQWFTLVVQGNSVTLITIGGIPSAILANNQQLVFVVAAQKPSSNTARTTVVISLVDDYTDATVLGFERASYMGRIENDVSTIEPIILSEGYTTEVSFALTGDLSSYFNLVTQGSTVNVVLQSGIPEQLIPANRIVVVQVEATAPRAISAVTTVVFEVVQEGVVAMEELVFSAPYYTGQFSEAEGLVFETAITLAEGYDINVQFTLEGDHAQWFTLVVQGNSVTLITTGGIPSAILANNQQLVFVVAAQKPSSNTARTTVVISLVDDYTDATVLGFERASYMGRIENDVSTIEPIILSEGYTTEVSFALTGDLSSYFNLVTQGSTVNVVLQSGIPEQSIPANRIVVVQVEATAPRAISAVTTVVFEVVQEGVVAMEELVFSAPYYTGQFSEAEGLVFETAITLAEGYDINVQFTLEGDHAQWFTLVVQGNSVTLITTGGIPSAILANNQQLVFVVAAQKPSRNTARTTVVISLVDDYTDATVLGFERASYMGRIENDVSTIEPIILSEGYTTEVSFALTGDLSSYFNLVTQGSTVNVVLQSGIPEQSIPANRIVVVQVEATAPRAISAVTTVVFEVVQEEVVAMEDLVFSAPYYTGQFSESEGLVFETAITLAEGYDENVQFTLEGDHAQWFTLVVQGNSVTLITTGGIPSAILANNQQLVFVVAAQKPSSNTARTTVVISLVDDYTDATVLGFERASYMGRIENDVSTIEPIILSEGYTTEVSFALTGDLSSYFNLVTQGSTVNVVLQSGIPEQSIPANRIVVVQVEATAPRAISAVTTVVLEVVQEGVVAMEELVFSAPYYTGQFSEAEGLVFETAITLAEGYDINVQFTLEGDHAQWFTLVVQGNSVTLITTGGIPSAILANNQQLVFVVAAQKPSSNTARTTVVISLVDDYTDATVLGFERASYMGRIENDVSTIEPIILSEGYTTEVSFALTGDLSSYFNLVTQGSTVNVVLQSGIPEQSIPANRIVVVQVEATAPRAISAVTTVVLEVVQEGVVAMEELVFSAPYYTGQFSEAEGLVFETAITLAEGYDINVQFTLEGDHAQWFTLVVQGNSVTLITTGGIPSAILANNQQLVFVVAAQKPSSNTARTTVVISLVDDYTDATVLGFERASYTGRIENDVSTIEPIILSEGYTTEVSFALTGDLSSYFNLVTQGSTVNVVLQSGIPEQLIPANRIVVVQVEATAPRAISAVTTVVFEVVQEEFVAMEELVFSAPYYTGQFSEAEGLVFETAITLAEGYDENVQFTLEGDHAQWFTLVVEGNSVTLTTTGAIPPAILAINQQLVFVVAAQKPNSNTARAIVVISLVDESRPEQVSFDKLVYEGTIRLSEVQHENIIISGYTGDIVDILGDYRDLFSASITEGAVLVTASGTLGLPEDVTHVLLELRAGGASAVLLLNVLQSETPELPSVSFESPSYVLRAEMAQTGLVGRVSATASNGENVAYSLAVSDAHLQARVSVNGAGEIHLSAPTNTGVYSFQVIATSVITQVQAMATVQLTIEATAICGDDAHMLPPLIILDRDEEEPHQNLVVIDSATQAGCEFRLTNRWPLEQDWLYVDGNGLHARSIDREDERIAFMALSQVQVELVLECADDTQTRVKRSPNTNSRLDWLGPYEYGSNNWILTDTILYNSRRSFVNLIVNDINDNYPTFVEKSNEPIVVGYPKPELEDVVLPRALAELKATDADVGENAALMYWSDEEVLAVAPRTGSVHVRDGVTLADDALLTVSVTDRNGHEEGLTGTIQLLVKLIDARHIAVVTVRNAFLDQEEAILSNLTAAVGYEVKVLSSAVISDDTNANPANSRHKREVTNAEGASLQLYVYGVIDREPVAVEQLSTDITENVLAGIDVTNTISLEDHLEGRAIPGGRDTGLLVATIVLSVLLFILIVAIAVWFFLRWRKARNYEQFSDTGSVASRSEPLEPPPKVDSVMKPRMDLEELKRSERRLQEMLEAPIDGVAAKPSTSVVEQEGIFDTIINMAPPTTVVPIVIQSIDKLKDDENSGDEDEYGERKNKSRRKSVVTFNENVEKIIHVEDTPDDNSSEIEVFRF